MGYIVSKALVITRKEDGSDLYLYYGSPVPAHVKDDELLRLIEGEFIAEDGDVQPEDKPAAKSAAK